jgi:hypothetical protein
MGRIDDEALPGRDNPDLLKKGKRKPGAKMDRAKMTLPSSFRLNEVVKAPGFPRPQAGHVAQNTSGKKIASIADG